VATHPQWIFRGIICGSRAARPASYGSLWTIDNPWEASTALRRNGPVFSPGISSPSHGEWEVPHGVFQPANLNREGPST
jgi:hypothetical protein